MDKGDFCKNFHSFNKLYEGKKEITDLQLKILHHGEDVIEINLINQEYKKTLFRFKEVAFIFLLYGLVRLTFQFSSFHRSFIIDIFFLLWIIYLIQRMSSVVQKVKLLLCRNFAFQYEVRRNFFRKSNRFIAIENIYDIVLNEVIENLDIHYILIVRTCEQDINQKYIFPVFNELKPSVDCLEIILKEINTFLRKPPFDEKHH